MTITRRGFLGAILAAGSAPALIPITCLMKPRAIWTPDRLVWTDSTPSAGGVAITNFSELSAQQKAAWMRDMWKVGADQTILNIFLDRLPRSQLYYVNHRMLS